MAGLAAVGLLFVLLFVFAGRPAVGPPRAPFAYYWPVKPFDRQHPIRGAFGDPRTLAADQPFGSTGPAEIGHYSFHTGIDIVAAPGTPVYPVVSGRVALLGTDQIKIASSKLRLFQYWHLRANVELGQDVVAGQTVLGWIQRPFDHVHFGEIDDHRGQNPLARGHLAPYADHTTPRVASLFIGPIGQSPEPTGGGVLNRDDELAIEAVNEPPVRVDGPFADLPQTPALVEWRLRTGLVWGRWHVSADFRRDVPVNEEFWRVYAPGTYQNAPVFARRLYRGVAGQYLFRVHLAVRRLRPGRYELEARVADIRGNSSTATWPLQMAEPRAR